MEINRANKLNAKEAMEKEAHRKQEAAAGATQEAGRNAEDYDDLDGLADTMVVSTVGGPSKKRRWDDEKDNIA